MKPQDRMRDDEDIGSWHDRIERQYGGKNRLRNIAIWAVLIGVAVFSAIHMFTPHAH